METPQPVPETSAKNNRTLWMIGGAVIGLCCCSVIAAVAGFYVFFPFEV